MTFSYAPSLNIPGSIQTGSPVSSLEVGSAQA